MLGKYAAAARRTVWVGSGHAFPAAGRAGALRSPPPWLWLGGPDVSTPQLHLEAPVRLRSPRHHCLGTRSQWGDAWAPHLRCTGCRDGRAPPAPPVINFHQWPSGSRAGGGGMMAEKHSAFPLIAKINTLKFLQEAEECGTAGKNCFIICNNTKARGGGREGGENDEL